MKFVVRLVFSDGTPMPELIRSKVEASFGGSVLAHPHTTDDGIRFLTLEAEHAPDESEGSIYFEGERMVVVVVDEPPTHFQWAVVAALKDLGGQTDRRIPAWARKRWSEVSWIQSFQWKRRLFGVSDGSEDV